MKSIKTLISTAAVLLIVTSAFAQRGHGPVGGSSNTGGMGYGMDAGMGGMSLLVAPDGTVITSTEVLDSATNLYRSSVVAVNASGSVAWRWAAPNGVHRLELAGNLVLVSTGAMGYGATTSAVNAELTALSLSTGSVAWKLSLPGIATAIEPSTNVIYVLTMLPQTPQGNGPGSGMGGGQHGPPSGGGTGTGMMNGNRTLVAISNSGVILWKLALN